jgi:hypothetical protein
MICCDRILLQVATQAEFNQSGFCFRCHQLWATFRRRALDFSGKHDNCPLKSRGNLPFEGVQKVDFMLAVKNSAVAGPFLPFVFSARPDHHGKRHRLWLPILANISLYGIGGNCEQSRRIDF